ncbi:MAG: fused MFS/spermidine synthase [Candidatus Eremiobacterota bacterium]
MWKLYLLKSLIILTGSYSITAQILLMREFLVLFSGNELSIGIIFACWFCGISAGSALGGYLKGKEHWQTLFLTIFIMSIILPVDICLIRQLRTIFSVSPGEFMPLLYIITGTICVIFPLTFSTGFFFPAACRVMSGLSGEIPSIQTGNVYGLESIGSLAGGVIFTFFLVYVLNPFAIIFLYMCLLSINCFILAIVIDRTMSAKYLRICFFIVFIISGILIFQSDGINQFFINKRWEGFSSLKLVETADSQYQNLALGRAGEQYSLYINGEYTSSFPDEYGSSLETHFIMSEHRDPKKILLIGGGAEGMIGIILKYPVERLDYIELDSKIIDMVKKYLPTDELCNLKDRRVNLYYSDGRYFVKNTKSSYDMVIVNLAEPHTAMLNRYYTVDFFREIEKILNPGGVFVTKLSSSENYIGTHTGNYSASIYRSLRAVFSHVIITPGDKNYLFACNSPGVITTDRGELSERYKERNIETDYFSPYHFEILLPEDLIDFIKNSMEKQNMSLNTDIQPVTYFYNLILWDRYSGSGMSFILQKLSKINIIWIVSIILCLLLARILYIYIRQTDKKGEIKFNSFLSISMTGFSGMAMEIILIFAFQNIYGYIYQGIGLLAAIFMAGLSAGTFVMNKILSKRRDQRLILMAQGGLALFSLCLPLSVNLSRFSEYIFLLFILPAGFFTGFIFPLICDLYGGTGHGKIAGIINSADHVGALLGSILTGIIFIPLFGILKTSLLISLLNGVVFILWLIYFLRDDIKSV